MLESLKIDIVKDQKCEKQSLRVSAVKMKQNKKMKNKLKISQKIQFS